MSRRDLKEREVVSQTLMEEFPHGDILGSQRKGAKKGRKTLLPAALVRAREDKAASAMAEGKDVGVINTRECKAKG